MIKWQLQDAKNRFSELVRKAREEGPQVITLHGRDAVVVSANEYGKLSRPRGSLVDFLRKSPLVGAELDLSRSGSDAGLVVCGLPVRIRRYLKAHRHTRHKGCLPQPKEL